ncbi:translation initiation factor eIF-2B [Marinobacter orientalis]|uniref:Initiation factor 2B n=1 Tax=Marinobacter orientalis TaxID=1928859 RepID=A0A7Y0RB43_9GAMM|nr:initiation factor 2B [Marinobacter orientalis]NMT62833.1 initiation factor 2B [Marinobacter orientalis]TGX51510.1 initiation factor 2B [Marinobacter orientalis]
MTRFDDRAKALLNRLREDYESGATELALTTLKDLAAYVKATDPAASDLAPLLDELREARPSMIVIGNAMTRVQSLLENGDTPLAAVDQIAHELENASAAIAAYARQQVPANAVIMTHSASSVVLGLFRLLAQNQHRFSVICTQSSPGLEGHQLALALNDLGVPVTLITDAQMGLFITRADVVITGCDTWLGDGHFINKSGTRLLALAARAHHKPFWVLGDSFRHSDQASADVTLEEMPVNELHAPEGDWITPRNIYFETVPESLVTGGISEQGVFSFPGSPGR